MRALARLPKAILLGLLGVYRSFVSPWLPRACRFTPSCSEYARQALERHGVVRGVLLTAGRLLRCRPGGPAGEDPVPATDPPRRPTWPCRPG